MKKKLLKGFLILVAVTLVVDLFIVGLVDKDFFDAQTETSKTEPAKEELAPIFNEEDALKKLQTYRITTQLHSPEIESGKTLEEVYQIKGSIPVTNNLGWYSEKTEKEGVYLVGYRQTISGSLQEPRWKVSEAQIRALNGKAITITPELGPESW
ncbi:MAG: hypothetical protein COU65_04745 [Candidatus Pacebacteria bacterium CG10_big_fil_rev_8_21_14_0_10_42_12]|nr:hypothetical protein [Candidatus Paceibacterota bacterium]PIR62185.1 MAG: hypothetical protein COU65_04745 [Candidatus Pacebacteria bacterium CG10_big_fil_rev_8_21_14_0_10_42_12]